VLARTDCNECFIFLILLPLHQLLIFNFNFTFIAFEITNMGVSCSAFTTHR